MGRMKEQLGERPATIGDLRRQGLGGILVRCVLPCRHIASVPFDKLGLPDDTAYTDILTLKRFRCQFCDRVATNMEVAVDRGPMSGWGMIPPGPS